MTDQELAMAHRYLYYVECDPAISDHEYDVIERRARAIAPEGHPIHGVGSSLPESYSAEIIALAKTLKD